VAEQRTGPADAAVVVVPWDPAWPQRFQQERALLQKALGPWLAGDVQHIGSTAVPGLHAKPVIDIMARVHALDSSRAAIAAVSSLGYLHHPYRAEVMRWFCKPKPEWRTHHLHLVPVGSPVWHERLDFRDVLRRDPGLAAEYSALKVALAKQHRHDREAYTEAKAPFVQRVLKQAARARCDEGSPPSAAQG